MVAVGDLKLTALQIVKGGDGTRSASSAGDTRKAVSQPL
jgi:hypothetical protein